MKYLSLLSIFALFAIKSISQISIHGSFFVVAKGSDGVMIACDSRSSLFDFRDSAHKTKAYYDSTQKAFIIGGNKVFVSTGSALFGNALLSGFISKFIEIYGDSMSLPDFFPLFNKFCEKYISAKSYDMISQNVYCIVGYENNKPSIYYHTANTSIDSIKKSYNFRFITSAPCLFYSEYDSALTCEILGKLASLSIRAYTDFSKMQLEIGGPIRIIHLTQYKAEWIKNKPTFSYKTIDDVVLDYVNKKMKIVFLDKEFKTEFESGIRLKPNPNK